MRIIAKSLCKTGVYASHFSVVAPCPSSHVRLCTLLSGYSQRLELLASPPFYGCCNGRAEVYMRRISTLLLRAPRSRTSMYAPVGKAALSSSCSVFTL